MTYGSPVATEKLHFIDDEVTAQEFVTWTKSWLSAKAKPGFQVFDSISQMLFPVCHLTSQIR